MVGGSGARARSHGPEIVVFYSHSGGAGRSGTLANLAVLLANAGRRVLVVDLDADAPSQYRYLGPFFPADPRGAAELSAPLRLEFEFADRGGAVDFAGPTGPDDETRIAPDAVSREDLLARDYDYVLIDSPGGASSAVDHVSGQLPDVLVIGCTLAERSISGAGNQLRKVRRQGCAKRILPVPMRVDRRAPGRTERSLGLLRRTFDVLVQEMPQERPLDYWAGVEIPYVPDFAYDDSLVSMEESTELSEGLLRAYAGLAARVSQLTVEELLRSPVPEATRDRYLARRRASLAPSSRVGVVYTSADRLWAEWIVRILAEIAIHGELLPVTAQVEERLSQFSTTVLVMTPALADSSRLSAIVDALENLDQRLEATILVVTPGGVSGGDAQVEVPFSYAASLALEGLPASAAAEELLGYFGAPGVGAAAAKDGDYPGRELTQITNLSAHSEVFVGRDAALEKMRDHFAAHATSGAVCAVTGGPGIGKSRTAQEYAARFAACYDTVWAIPCGERESAVQSLLELSDALIGDRPRADALEGVLQTLGAPRSRALLIYDGLDDLDAVHDLIPKSGAHVLVAAREEPDLESLHVPLGPLEAAESAQLALALVAGISDGDALAGLVGHHPQSLVLAAHWIRTLPATPADELLAVLHDRLDAGRATEAGRISVLTQLLLERLAHSPWADAAARVLNTCLFLTPDGASPKLLSTAAFIEDLEGVDARLADPVVLDNVLAVLRGHGLLGSDRAAHAVLRIPYAVGESLRNLLSEQERAETEARVIGLLARCVPPAVEEGLLPSGAVYAELQRHLDVLPVERHLDVPTRRWLVQQVRYQWQRNDTASWYAGLRLADRLERAWNAGLDEPETDRLLAALMVQKANIHRSRNEFDLALALDERALVRQRGVLGVNHLRTLMCSRSYAADLRHAGRYDESLLEENATWQGFREALGPGHPLTVTASHNLSLSQLLSGEAGPALDRELDVLRRAPAIVSQEPDLRGYCLTSIGIHHRELGQYKAGLENSMQATRYWQQRVQGSFIPAAAPIVLEAAVNYAAARRRMARNGSVAPEESLWKEPLDAAIAAYEAGHACVLLCRANKAAHLHAAGQHQAAAEQALACRDGYAELLGPAHPYTGICTANAGAYLRHADRIEEAVEQSRLGWLILSRALGNLHPWLAIAGLNHAAALGNRGDHEEALAVSGPAIALLRELLGSEHPVVDYAGRRFGALRRANRQRGFTSTESCSHRFEIDLPYV